MARRTPTRAKGLPLTAHLTSSATPELERAVRRTYCGQAHFAIGPEYCSTCVFWGYWQQLRSAAGDIVGTRERRSSCRKYYELTGQHGPGIPASALACRHYQKRES